MSQYQKGKTNLDFTEARDSEWQWHQLGCMQVCTSLQTDNHTSTPLLSFLQAGCPSCRPTNSVKALKVVTMTSFRSISMPADFRRHFVGKTLRNVSCCDYRLNTLCWSVSDSSEIVLDYMIQYYLNNAINLHPLTPKSKLYVILYPQNGDRFVTIDSVTSLHLIYSA